MYDFDTLYPRVDMGSLKWDNAQKAGCPADIVPFTVADMEFKTAPVVVEAVRKVAEFGLWGYTYAYEEFQQSVLEWMERRHGWTGKREWMVHTSGVVQALYVAVNALTQPGDEILIQSPVYPPFFGSAKDTGRRLLENPLKLEGQRYEIDFEDLEEKLPRAKLMVFCNPHNPGGMVWSEEDVRRVAQLCAQHGVPLLSDEIHCDFVMPGHTHFSVGRLTGQALENSIIATSASKTFSLAGLACSTTFVPNKAMREKMQARLEADGYGFNTTFGTEATKTAYRAAEDWLDELLVYIEGNYRYVKEYFEANIPAGRVFPLEGTYLAWVDMNGFGLEPDEMMAFLHKEALLYPNDGRMFGAAGAGFIRINLACPKSVLEGAMKRLSAACDKMPKK